MNAFWWLPGIWLAGTKGPSDFAFSHSAEGVCRRLGQIFSTEAPIQSLLIAAGLPGMLMLLRRDRILGWACVGFCAAGFAWGYVAGLSKSLDFLQPGRHTYAFYLALAVAAGAMIEELLKRLRSGLHSLDRWVMIGAILIGVRVIGYPGGYSAFALSRMVHIVRSPEPPNAASAMDRRLCRPSSQTRPAAALRRGRVRRRDRRRAWGRHPAPSRCVPGRPTQRHLAGTHRRSAHRRPLSARFPANKLHPVRRGKTLRQEKLDEARLHSLRQTLRPICHIMLDATCAAVLRQNSDLVEILETRAFSDKDRTLTTFILARVKGFEGDFLEGSGQVEATAGVLRLHDLTPGLDGTVVLRYHSVPYLRARPEVAIEQEFREDDPVPFIRLRLPAGTSDVEVRLHLPVGR